MGIKQNYVCVKCGQTFTRQESGKRHNANLHSGQSLIVDSTSYQVGIINGKYGQPEGSPSSFRSLKAFNINSSIKQNRSQPNTPYSFNYKTEDFKTNNILTSEMNNRYNDNPYNKGRKLPDIQSHNYTNKLAHDYHTYYHNEEFSQYLNFDSLHDHTKKFRIRDVVRVQRRLKRVAPYLYEIYGNYLYCLINKIIWDCRYKNSYEPLDIFLRSHNLGFI
jgi:hypothetical protein